MADQRRADRAQSRAAKAAEKRERRAERTEFLRRPVPVDRSWARWVGGGLVLAAVCGFVWRVSERADPIVVVHAAQPAEQTTATSGVAPVSNPLAGMGQPVSNLAAAIVTSYDPANRTVLVDTSSGPLRLGASRIEDIAGQVWALGPTDPCAIHITSPNPTLGPKVVEKVDGATLPAGATPLFDCTAPSAPSTPTVAGG